METYPRHSANQQVRGIIPRDGGEGFKIVRLRESCHGDVRMKASPALGAVVVVALLLFCQCANALRVRKVLGDERDRFIEPTGDNHLVALIDE
jgi:hypothetical protein